jgi:hypothetical protein
MLRITHDEDPDEGAAFRGGWLASTMSFPSLPPGICGIDGPAVRVRVSVQMGRLRELRLELCCKRGQGIREAGARLLLEHVQDFRAEEVAPYHPRVRLRTTAHAGCGTVQLRKHRRGFLLRPFARACGRPAPGRQGGYGFTRRVRRGFATGRPGLR